MTVRGIFLRFLGYHSSPADPHEYTLRGRFGLQITVGKRVAECAGK
jgi:hypothetical protein